LCHNRAQIYEKIPEPSNDSGILNDNALEKYVNYLIIDVLYRKNAVSLHLLIRPYGRFACQSTHAVPPFIRLERQREGALHFGMRR
jgi:hypothetical protein